MKPSCEFPDSLIGGGERYFFILGDCTAHLLPIVA